MAGYTGKERRKYRRIYRVIGTNIVRRNSGRYSPKLDAEIGVNVSRSGILLECEKRLAKDDRLEVKVLLPFDSVYKAVRSRAKVVWTKTTPRSTYFIGCKFTKLSPKDRQIIRKYTASF